MNWLHVTQLILNWMFFLAGIGYGLLAFYLMLGTIFILGSNDTLLEVVGILAAGLVPLPAILLALRHRRLAACCLAAVTALWVAGYLDAHYALVKRFGNQSDPNVFSAVAKTSIWPFAFAVYYGVTDVLRWPLLWRRGDRTVHGPNRT